METPRTTSTFADYVHAGTTVLSMLAQARRIIPLFTGGRTTVAFGTGAVLGATGALVGVAFAVPEARQAILDRAGEAADKVRHLMSGGKAAPLAKVKQPPRPKPQPYRGPSQSLLPASSV